MEIIITGVSRRTSGLVQLKWVRFAFVGDAICKKIIAIQSLRGILTLMILLSHTPLNDTEYINRFGAWAVEVFLVLS